MDPGPAVTRLLKELVPSVTSCYVHKAHLKKQVNSNEAFIVNPNPDEIVTYLRGKPNSNDGNIIAKVPNDTCVKMLSASPERDYYHVELLTL
jgi:hypothetical protein